ncbi:MAG: serine hydrolase [Thermodesulfobacteriaceae bacterium]|nr:serine hydrolase [Thermodesulfobacteriaceae bacterium]MCX8041155.1 serine hydrolase [Thermodesulfobacteriaceae bacterium]MDW8135795.1 serine hydrolase [Thermodesulfobacterium sp.]
MLFNSLSSLLDSAIKEGVFPCALAGISYQEKRYIIGRGYRSLTPFLEPLEETDIFDLASLTKPLALSFILMYLISRESKIDPLAPLENYLDLKNPLKKISIFRFLNHTSGLKAWHPFYKSFIDNVELLNQERSFKLKKIIQEIEREPLQYTPGKGCLYSDLGYLVLTYLLEILYEKSLDKLFEEAKRIIPCSSKAFLNFNPLKRGVSQEKIVPTSVCPWTKKILRGWVEDENTRILDGVSGVSGLFGNLYGVLEILEFLLKIYKGEKLGLSSEVVKFFMEFKEEVSNFSLGFMYKSLEGYSALGKAFSKKTIGHLGFTGCSFFIDLEKDLIVILLTNRVHPERNNQKIKAFRPIFHQRLAELLRL